MKSKIRILRFGLGIFLISFFASELMCKSEQGAKGIRNIGSNLQLFVDDWLFEKMTDVSLKLHNPIRKEVVFKFDAPWEGKQSGYACVMKDEDKFRMYYRGGGDLTREFTCLAESDDGINWKRPSLKLFECNGSKENNIIWTGKEAGYWESHNFTPFKDDNPSALPEQRYKALTLGRYPDKKGEQKIVLLAFVSPDGIHWKRLREEPIITEGGFDSQNTAFWDKAEKRYVCYLRIGREGKRSISRSTSSDFINWSKPEFLDFGNTPLEQFYTNAIIPYFRSPHLYLGFPMRFVPERKVIGIEKRVVDGMSDGVFMSSYDGLHWNRIFMEAFIRPGLSPNNWGDAHGNNTPIWGMLPTGKDEISIYWCENYGDVPQVRRGIIRTDGFVSVSAPYQGGEFITRLITFEGENLVINYSTSAVGSIKVEILDESGNPITKFDLNSSEEIYGDEIERIVTWKDGSDVSQLMKKPIRLHFLMKDADLFSIQFKN